MQGRVEAWGGATATRSWIHRPTSIDAVREVFRVAVCDGRTIGIRGAGQSYGDAALATDAICLDLSGMSRIISWDADTGRIDAEPGVTIAQLWRATIADGWWPAVVPGTMAVSLGGAAAMNIHGKNNWKAGPIGDHILDFDLLLPSGEIVPCSRETEPELFHAVIGGFGMLGVVVRVGLRLKRIHSGMLDVEAISASSLDAMLACIEERTADADYLVGWIDTLKGGAGLGRGLVHEARLLAPGDDPHGGDTLNVPAQELPPTLFGVLPKSVMWRLMQPFMHDPGVRLVNAVKYVQGRLTHGHRFRQSHVGFHFLLDYVPEWKRAYGRGGLIQFQSFIPKEHASGGFRAILETAQRAGLPPYLGVLKRHRPDDFLLTHAVDGFSLALDFKVTTGNRERVWRLAADLARIVAELGGRFYPAKDSTLDAATYATAVGGERLERFRALKATHDPSGLLQTDLSKRLLPPG